MTATTVLKSDIITQLISLNPLFRKFDLSVIGDVNLGIILANLSRKYPASYYGNYAVGSIIKSVEYYGDSIRLTTYGLIYSAEGSMDGIVWSNGKLSISYRHRTRRYILATQLKRWDRSGSITP